MTAFSVQGTVLWNKLPHDIKAANSENIKNKLKSYFCGKAPSAVLDLCVCYLYTANNKINLNVK